PHARVLLDADARFRHVRLRDRVEVDRRHRRRRRSRRHSARDDRFAWAPGLQPRADAQLLLVRRHPGARLDARAAPAGAVAAGIRGGAAGTPFVVLAAPHGCRMSSLLELRGLRKAFADFTAVDGVDLALPSRGITAVIGPNGAGKTTLIDLVSGKLVPDAGEV